MCAKSRKIEVKRLRDEHGGEYQIKHFVQGEGWQYLAVLPVHRDDCYLFILLERGTGVMTVDFKDVRLTLYVWPQARETRQNIRGVVVDASTRTPLPYGKVVLKNQEPFVGLTTDSLGRFVFSDLPVGRYDVEASYMGYDPVLVREVLLTSARETVLEIALAPGATTLDDVVVRPTIDKSCTLNNMVLSGGRMLSTEEGGRFAGGLDDPARLASAFAGVQTNIGDNGIVVRGNAPKML